MWLGFGRGDLCMRNGVGRWPMRELGQADVVRGSMSRWVIRTLWAFAVAALGFGALLVRPAPTWALGGTPCVSNDNHMYYIVTTASSFAQVTSVALTDSTASACSEQGSVGTVLTSLATGINN